MKNIYRILFASNTTKIEENYLLNLSELEKNDDYLKRVFDNIVLSPNQKVLDNILKIAREI